MHTCNKGEKLHNCIIQIQKDYSASDTRTTGNDAQFIPMYTELDETLRHSTSCTGCYNVSYSYYCLLYRCVVAVTISEHQWEVVIYCSRPLVVSCVFSHCHIISWSCGWIIHFGRIYYWAQGHPPGQECSSLIAYDLCLLLWPTISLPPICSR